jgi:hypothetical protein
LPLASHVRTPLPEHCAAPGVQTPEHAPDTHAALVHAHVCTALPEQRTVPG